MHEPGEQVDLIAHLERDQLAAETMKPVERARLSAPVIALLWALRVFVVVMGVLVAYVFFASL